MNRFKRIVLIVLDSAGIGEMPDAADYGDAGSDTIGHTLEQVAAMWREAALYEPQMAGEQRQELLGGWHRALDRSRGWAA